MVLFQWTDVLHKFFFTVQVFSHDASNFNHMYSTIHRHMIVNRGFYLKIHSKTEFVLLPIQLKSIQVVSASFIQVLVRSWSMIE